MENIAKKNFDIWKIVSLVILGLYGLFLIFPLVKLLYNAFFSDGVFTLEQFQKFFGQSDYSKTIVNSFKITLFVTALTLLIGILQTGVAYSWYFGSIPEIPTQTFAVLGYLEPTMSVLCSALILREPMGLTGWIGALLIIGAAVVNELI